MDKDLLQQLWQQEVMASARRREEADGREVEDLEIIQQNDLMNTDHNFGQMSLLFASSSIFAA